MLPVLSHREAYAPRHAAGGGQGRVLGLRQARRGPGGEGLRARRRESRGPLREGAAQVRIVLCGAVPYVRARIISARGAGHQEWSGSSGLHTTGLFALAETYSELIQKLTALTRLTHYSDCSAVQAVLVFVVPKRHNSLSLNLLLTVFLNCSNWLHTCFPSFIVLAKHCHSLLTYFHVVSHIFFDVDRAAFLHPDRLEFAAAHKGVFTNLLERAGERYFFDLAIRETLFPDVLHAIRDLDASETVAVREHPCLNPLQRRRELDTLYLGVCKDFSFAFYSILDLLYT